ncbi:Ankyrin repeat-containing domain [Pseudocohnilembus persalinus]|uniref:Ankyrin repeat-containing domain n=1 Tax=Pseudocohnilembus persalinus TaxID=266149 RepID=A0A0V0R7E4_PSEPJ|nr:Ankyrin repeat-containing domain [Pseudocohnilembus persalinus]|eukprot:KRX10250.1 Ankyrin repeat-containing domain [Pseudocohnilembus persalinus]
MPFKPNSNHSMCRFLRCFLQIVLIKIVIIATIIITVIIIAAGNIIATIIIIVKVAQIDIAVTIPAIVCIEPLELVDFFNCLGADKNTKQFNNCTPLHVSSFNHQKDIISLLLLQGANSKIINDSNVIAIQECENQTQILKIFDLFESYKNNEILNQQSKYNLITIPRITFNPQSIDFQEFKIISLQDTLIEIYFKKQNVELIIKSNDIKNGQSILIQEQFQTISYLQENEKLNILSELLQQLQEILEIQCQV